MERSRLLLYLTLASRLVKKADVVDDNDSQPVAPETEESEDALVSELFQLAYEHEAAEGDTAQMQTLADWASGHGMSVPSLPTLNVSEAQKASPHAVVAKAWSVPQGAIVEGWVSTEDEDQDQDIVPVEAFASGLPSYAARRMPLSSEHAMKAYPIGHGQRIALVRDGKVLSEAEHPADAAAFEHFPGSGTGVYGRFLVTDPDAARAVTSGNVGGFSWIGKAHYEPRPTGKGRIFRRVDPWMECTIAAYPRNTGATVVAAKTL